MKGDQNVPFSRNGLHRVLWVVPAPHLPGGRPQPPHYPLAAAELHQQGVDDQEEVGEEA